MVMPLCGTFDYTGVVPDTKADWMSGSWKVHDKSWRAASGKRGVRWFSTSNSLRDDRLVGLEPTLRLSDGRVALTASGRNRARVQAASFELSPALIECFESGDVLTLVRTATADIGVSLVRADELIFAIGAVTVVPLGPAIEVQGGPREIDTATSRGWPRTETWIDVSYPGHTSRFRGGDDASIGAHRISVLRCFEDGIPGSYETVAISRSGMCPHNDALHSAKSLAGPNAGLRLTQW